jgi:hypothetical protein
MSIRHAVPVVLLLALAGCGKEAGRIRLPGEGSGAVEIPLEAGEVDFWTDLDITYEGDATMQYRVELFQKGYAAGTAACNPLGHLPTKTSWVETNVGQSHSRRGSGKMECSTTITSGGPTLIKTTLAFSKKPTAVTLKKADLVIKQ